MGRLTRKRKLKKGGSIGQFIREVSSSLQSFLKRTRDSGVEIYHKSSDIVNDALDNKKKSPSIMHKLETKVSNVKNEIVSPSKPPTASQSKPPTASQSKPDTLSKQIIGGKKNTKSKKKSMHKSRKSRKSRKCKKY